MHSDPGCGGCPCGASSAAVSAPAAAGRDAAASSAHSRVEDDGARPVLPLRRQQRGGPALVDVADALEGLGVGAQPEQRAEALLVGGVLEGLVARRTRRPGRSGP